MEGGRAELGRMPSDLPSRSSRRLLQVSDLSPSISMGGGKAGGGPRANPLPPTADSSFLKPPCQVQLFSERERESNTNGIWPRPSVLGRLVGFFRVHQRISPSTSKADSGPFCCCWLVRCEWHLFHFYILKKQNFKNICRIGKFSKMGVCRPPIGGDRCMSPIQWAT